MNDLLNDLMTNNDTDLVSQLNDIFEGSDREVEQRSK